MLDANKTLTHVIKTYDPLSRKNTYTTETIKNCSWFRTQAQSFENGVVKMADVIKARIPTHGRTSIPKIKKGDLLINGVADIKGLTIAQMRDKYADSMEVQSVTYNLESLPYSQHIRVSGS